MVIGNAAGGKSTMCRSLCAIHKLPYFAIDQIQWQPGWVQTPLKDYHAAHNSWIGEDRWLVDGYGPWDSVLKRMDAADTIILVDHPLRVHYWWATKRQVKSLFFGRTDGPSGCPMWPVTTRLYKMIWSLHRNQRSLLLSEAQLRSKTKRYIHLRSPSELRQFTENPA